MALSISGICVEDESEAETLFFYHLRLAALYFEATGTGLDCRVPGEFASPAFTAFIGAMEALYEDI